MVAGRDGPPFRSRERRQLQQLCRVAEARGTEIARLNARAGTPPHSRAFLQLALRRLLSLPAGVAAEHGQVDFELALSRRFLRRTGRPRVVRGHRFRAAFLRAPPPGKIVENSGVTCVSRQLIYALMAEGTR